MGVTAASDAVMSPHHMPWPYVIVIDVPAHFYAPSSIQHRPFLLKQTSSIVLDRT